MEELSEEKRTDDRKKTEGNMKVYMILLFCVTAYASTFIFGSILVKSFNPVTLTFLRLVFINAFLLLIGWRFVKNERVPPRILLILALAGFIGIAICHVSLHTGLQYTDPITAALIYALGPLITSLITYFYLKEKRTIYFWLGIIIGIVGVAFVVSDGKGLALHIGKGEVLIGVTITTYSIYLVFVQYLTKYVKPIIVTVYTSVFAMVSLIPFLRVESIVQAFHVDVNYWIILITTALLTNGLATMLWNGAIRHVGAATSSLFLNVEPFAAMILSYIILQQVVLPIQLVGSVFIITGVIMGTRFGRRTQLTGL